MTSGLAGTVGLAALAVELIACGTPQRSPAAADAGGAVVPAQQRPLPPVPVGPDGEPDHAAWRRLVIDTTPLEPRRLEALGLEVWVPGDVQLPDVPGRTLTIDTPGCLVYLQVDPPYRTPAEARDYLQQVSDLSLSRVEERELADGWQQVLSVNLAGRPLQLHQQVRTLGATPVECQSEQPECVAWLCPRLRALPGGAAEIAHSTDPPVVTIHERDHAGLSGGSVEISAAGSVHFYGPGCPTWRGRSTTIEPARVDRLIADLDRSRPSSGRSCRHCATTSVSVRGPDGWFTVEAAAGIGAPGAPRAPPAPGSADAILRGFHDQVGLNPCRRVPARRPVP